MDFLSPHYRRRHGRLLFVSYILSALVVGALVMFFALEASGFYINRSGELLLNSVVFVDSHPNNAEIYIDGRLERSRTGARLVLPEGSHFVEIQRPGYELWQKQIYFGGGEVTYIQYPFLYPSEPLNKVVDSYPAQATASQSPDRRWLMVHPKPNQLVFELLDLNHDDLLRRNLSFELPESELEERELLKVEVLDWSRDNRNFLVEIEYDDGFEYWLLSTDDNREPLVIVQINDSSAIKEIRLLDDKIRQVYVLYQDGQLLLQDLDQSEPTSELIAEDVLEFKSYGEDLLVYVRSTALDSLAEVVIINNETTYPLLELSDISPDTNYVVDLSRFEGDWYYAVGSDTSKQLAIFKNPLEAIKQNRQLIAQTRANLNNVTSLVFSANVRFVGATYAGGIYVYDLEDQRSYRYNIADLSADYQIQWMDGHRLYGSVASSLNIWEFDSRHQIELGELRSSSDVFFDDSYDTVYVLRLGDQESIGELELNAADLIIKRD